MNQSFTISSLLIPCVVFAFGLYIGIVPTEGKRNQTFKRTIICGIGIAFGLFQAFSAVSKSQGLMNTTQAYYYLCSISIIGWCIYAFFTNHSSLSKCRKILKAILYWFFTGCFLTSSSYNRDVRILALSLEFILPIIGYYSGLIDRIKKDNQLSVADMQPKKIVSQRAISVPLVPTSPFSTVVPKEGCREDVYIRYTRRKLTKLRARIIHFYHRHQKILKTVLAVILILILLPFVLRLLNLYWDFIRDFAGFPAKHHKRFR